MRIRSNYILCHDLRSIKCSNTISRRKNDSISITWMPCFYVYAFTALMLSEEKSGRNIGIFYFQVVNVILGRILLRIIFNDGMNATMIEAQTKFSK